MSMRRRPSGSWRGGIVSCASSAISSAILCNDADATPHLPPSPRLAHWCGPAYGKDPGYVSHLSRVLARRLPLYGLQQPALVVDHGDAAREPVAPAPEHEVDIV